MLNLIFWKLISLILNYCLKRNYQVVQGNVCTTVAFHLGVGCELWYVEWLLCLFHFLHFVHPIYNHTHMSEKFEHVKSKIKLTHFWEVFYSLLCVFLSNWTAIYSSLQTKIYKMCFCIPLYQTINFFLNKYIFSII